MDRKTIPLVAVVLFMITAWIMGALFHTIESIEGSQFPRYRRDTWSDEGDEISSDRAFVKKFLVAGILSLITLIVTWGVMAYLYEGMNKLLFQGIVAAAAVGVFLVVILAPIDICAFTSMPERAAIGEISPDTNDYDPEAPTQTNYLLPFIIVVVFTAFVVIREYLSISSRKETKKQAKDSVSETIDRTLKKLYRGADVRSAIIRCYIEMSYHLEEKGIRNKHHLTSREFRTKALKKLDIPPELLFNLTSIFEEARYSKHPMGEKENNKAIDNLRQLKKALTDNG
ncbi:MAG: DUF4129 domain-containing protein [Thermoplasmata archaeon]